jgi:hypothetical protein
VSHFVLDEKPDIQYGQQDAQHREGQVKKIDLEQTALFQHKLMGKMNGILQDYGCQSAYQSNQQSEQIHLLPVAEMLGNEGNETGEIVPEIHP